MAMEASMQFLQWSSLYEKEKPFQIFMDLLPDAKDRRKTNLVWEERQILVEDFRQHAQDFQLDTHGFTTRHLPGFTELQDKSEITGSYIPEVTKMLRTELDDVGTVFVFDWRVRSSRGDTTAGSKINFSDQTQPLLPSNYAHTDTTPVSVIQRIKEKFPDDAARILRNRVRAVNVWKPLSHPVDEYALAVCDGTTVKPDDLVETDSIRQGIVSTHYYAKYNENQQWYFLHRQCPDEALIFKHVDSQPGIKAPYTLHSSMKHQSVAEDAKPRRSIEVRALLFSEVV